MILVTGGTGLVGSHLLYKLCVSKEPVRAIMRESSDLSIVKKIFHYYSPENADDLLSCINWVEADITDIFSVKEAVKGVEKVYHCAAVVSFVPSDIKTMYEINIEGTANIVNASLEAAVKKLVHCSSISAIGKPQNGIIIDENTAWKDSLKKSNYARSKHGAEREVWRGIEEGLNAVIVNPSIILGPGHPYRSSAQMYSQSSKGLKFYVDGSTGFVDARDVVNAIVWLMNSNISGERFILNSENIKYKDVFEMFARYIGVKPPGIKAGKLLTQIAWRLEKIRCKLTRRKPLITKETVRNAMSNKAYSNEKFIKASGYKFIPVDEAVANTCRFFEKYPLPW